MARCAKYESPFDEIFFTLTKDVYPVMIELELFRVFVRSSGKIHDLKVVAEGLKPKSSLTCLEKKCDVMQGDTFSGNLYR